MSQAASNVQIAIKKQAGKGTRATGASATAFNVAGTGGITGTMASITSPTIRRDGLRTLDGLGSRKGAASYPMVMGVAKQDMLFPPLLRVSAWLTIADITEADITSITTGANTITAASGNFLTLGLRRGMRIKLAGHSSAGNNGRWLTILSVTATVITVLETLTVNAVADTAITIVVAKHAYAGAAPVESYYTIEEYNQDIDESELLEDAKLNRFEFNGSPDAKIITTFGFLGRDFQFLDTADAPNFTSPTTPSGREMELSDGVIIRNGVAQNIVTDLSFTYDMGGDVPSVLAQVGPDVFLGNAGMSGSLGAIREDLDMLRQYRAKTAFELMIIAQEAESDPIDFVSFYAGNCLFGAPSKGIAQDGPMRDTLPFSAGIDDNGGDRAATILLISSSAA